MNSVEMEFQRSKSTIETSTTARASANISRVGLKEGRSSRPYRNAGGGLGLRPFQRSIHPLSRGVQSKLGFVN
jgi:hypothetical protein